MRRAARLLYYGVCKHDGAVKPVDGYGRTLRLIIALRYFECGTNTETLPGRSCSIFGVCQTYRSSIATPTPQNLPLRHGIDARQVKIRASEPASLRSENRFGKGAGGGSRPPNNSLQCWISSNAAK